MRLKSWFAGAALFLALAPALAHRPAAVLSRGVREAHPHRVRGAVHVHSGFSTDGYGDIDSIAREAREAGLGFVIVTDHNTEASLGDAYRHGVLVLGGCEESTDGGHALILGLSALPFRLDGDPDSVVRDVSDLGGFVIAAHPTSSQPEGAWTGEMTGVSALEFMNLAEPGIWPARGPALLLPLTRYAVDPQGALLGALRFSRRPLELWDRLLARRPIAGTLGSDAHGGLPSHQQMFLLASQHVLLRRPLAGDAAVDRPLVLEALREGNGYGALDSLADASGFLFEARSGTHRGGMGDAVPLEGEAELLAEADAPAGTTLVLLRDGLEVARGERILYRSGRPGAYRVEAHLDPSLGPAARGLPWILSNPVYVFDAGELERRAERARLLPSEAAPWPAAVEPIESFDGAALGARWQIDRSPDATAASRLEARALRFDFALGSGPKSHASVCDWGSRDFSPHRGLVFRVRADRRFRFDVQVRVAGEAAPGGVRIWRRSVRAEAEWQRIVLPFSTLKTYDRRGGAPALDRTRGIYFHVDEAHLAPGSRGTLWIDDLGAGR